MIAWGPDTAKWFRHTAAQLTVWQTRCLHRPGVGKSARTPSFSRRSFAFNWDYPLVGGATGPRLNAQKQTAAGPARADAEAADSRLFRKSGLFSRSTASHRLSETRMPDAGQYRHSVSPPKAAPKNPVKSGN